MNLRSLLPIGLLALAGADAGLAQTGLTRAQVRADLEQALRTGDIAAPGEVGLPLNQLHPHRYPARAQLPGRTREEVRAELAHAQRTGDLFAGESALRQNEVHPHLYPAVAMAAGRTREEVKSELAEAIRAGDLIAGGELALKVRELSPGRYRANPRAMAEGGPEAQRGIFSLRN
jgi:hypothetical protein